MLRRGKGRKVTFWEGTPASDSPIMGLTKKKGGVILNAQGQKSLGELKNRQKKQGRNGGEKGMARTGNERGNGDRGGDVLRDITQRPEKRWGPFGTKERSFVCEKVRISAARKGETCRGGGA